jgi:hypothetical protein
MQEKGVCYICMVNVCVGRPERVVIQGGSSGGDLYWLGGWEED